MKSFWITVVVCLIVAFFGMRFSTPTFRGDEQSIIQRIAELTAAGLLVAVVWAIAFRSQLERGRVSLLSILMLVALEAIWFAAKGVFNP